MSQVNTDYHTDYHDHPDGTCECGHHRDQHAYPGAASTMCALCACPTYRVLHYDTINRLRAEVEKVKEVIDRFRTSGDGGPTAWETVSAIEEILS